MKKTVVFIAGTDFSGTTMLDLTLGSLPECRSLGEVHAFFRPTVSRQKHVTCSCGKLCDFWRQQAMNGESDFYTSIFNEYPDINFLIDSSKSVPWIELQSKKLLNSGYNVKHILIRKEPYEFKVSREKRGKGNGWAKSWIRYHQAYFSTKRIFFSVSLTELLTDFNLVMKEICEWLSIELDSNIRDYWKFTHHIVFGSATARLKLHEKGTPEAKLMLNSSHRKDINMDAKNRNATPIFSMNVTKRQIRTMNQISKLLEKRGVKTISDNSLSAYTANLLFHIKSFIEQKLFLVRFGRRLKLIQIQDTPHEFNWSH